MCVLALFTILLNFLAEMAADVKEVGMQHSQMCHAIGT